MVRDKDMMMINYKVLCFMKRYDTMSKCYNFAVFCLMQCQEILKISTANKIKHIFTISLFINIAAYSDELIQNGSFENGNIPWKFGGTAQISILPQGRTTVDGTCYGYLGQINNISNEYIYQDVSIPNNTSSMIVSYYYNITTEDVGSIANDTLTVSVYEANTSLNKTTLQTLSNLHRAKDANGSSNSDAAASKYTKSSFNLDVNAYKGKEIRLRFDCRTNSSLFTAFRIDVISVNILYQTQEIITFPNGISGSSNPTQNIPETYSVNSASSNLGHTVVYSYNWGDGNVTGPTISTSASHAWSTTGSKTIAVTAQCQTHSTISSQITKVINVQPATSETVSYPGPIQGNTSPKKNTPETYTASGSTCSLGHTIQYSFNWGDGTPSSTYSTTKSVSHQWASIGTKTITVIARCLSNTNVTNSASLQVEVSDSLVSWSGNVKVYLPDGREASGICADGAATVEIRATNIPDGISMSNISCQVNPSSVGMLSQPVYDAAAKTVKWSYTAPKDYPEAVPSNDPTVKPITFNVTVNSISKQNTNLFNCARTPIVLVHGIGLKNLYGGSSSSFNDMKNYLKQSYRYVNAYNYSENNISNFNTNRLVAENAVNETLKIAKNDMYSALKVDYVGHSMGGILGRYYIQDLNAPNNPYKNDIRRFITIGTPHSGSFFADLPFVVAIPEKIGVMILEMFYAEKIDKRLLSTTAIYDLRTTSYAIDNYLNYKNLGKNNVPSHAIVTYGLDLPFDNTKYTIIKKALEFIEFAFSSLDGDCIVEDISQSGGLNSKYVSEINNVAHWDQTKTISVHEETDRLLKENDENLHFNSSGFVSPVDVTFLQLFNKDDALSEKYFKINKTENIEFVKPIIMSEYYPGDNVYLEIENIDSIKSAFYMTNFWYEEHEERINTAQFKIPSDYYGELEISVMGKKSDGTILIGSTTINVRNIAKITDITYGDLNEINLYTNGNYNTSVYGNYDDNSVRNISSSDSGTTYSVSDPSVISVSGDGLLTGLKSGSSELFAKNSGLEKSIIINVQDYPTSTQNGIVPDVIGSEIRGAIDSVYSADMIIGDIDEQNSKIITEGQVLGQNPAPGTQAKLGTPVNIIVSAGPKMVKVPNMVNRAFSDAQTIFANNSFIVLDTSIEYNATVKYGSVISQDPMGGMIVPEGTSVSLIVSGKSGAVSVSVIPEEIRDVGARWRCQEYIDGQWSDTSDWLVSGVVSPNLKTSSDLYSYRVRFNARTDWVTPSSVPLIVSDGQTIAVIAEYKRRVPNVLNLSEEVARAEVEKVGLLVGGPQREYHATVPKGSIIRQIPVADSKVSNGSTVDLVVSLGPVGSVKVDILPAEVVAVGAKWRVLTLDDSEVTRWQESGTTWPNLVASTNLYKIRFLTRTGWRTPSEVPFDVIANQTVTIGRTYTRQTVTVPNVVGKAQSLAVSEITGAGLVVGSPTTEEYSTTVPSGSVIRQTPASGAQVDYGSAVSLVISKGPAPIVTGSVKVNILPAEVVSAGARWRVLTQDGGEVSFGQQSGTTLSNLVAGANLYKIRFNSRNGWRTPSDKPITITANQTAQVEGTYTPLPEHDLCQNALEAVINETYTKSNVGAETDVTIQGLNDGADVWHKFTPDLAGQYTISLCDSQFDTTLGVFIGSCGTLTELSHDNDGCIQASSLSIYLEPGSTYLIRVAGYGSATGDYSLLITHDVVLVPDLIGLSETEARDYLEESGLFVGSVTTQCVGTIAAGNVISQNPVSGSEVALGSSVDLLVSSGPCPIMYPLMIMTPLNGKIVVTPSQGPDGYLAGTQVTVQAVPNDGYVFRSWTEGLFGYPGNPASFVMNGGITIGAVFAQQTEGEPEPEITAAARALHDYFQTADRNNDGRLSYMEASQQVPGFSIAQFNFLDVDRVGYLTESGLADLLGLSTGEEPLCGCLGCEKSDMSLNGMKKHLGDLFLAGLAMSCLLMFSRRKG